MNKYVSKTKLIFTLKYIPVYTFKGSCALLPKINDSGDGVTRNLFINKIRMPETCGY